VKAGADVITFSGDKLLGGPQAGLVAGQAELIERIRRHPLARALRVDKLTLAALEATLGLWRTGRRQAVPSVRMLEESADSVQARAEALGEAIGQVVPWMIVPCSSAAGGGTRPEEVIKSYAVSVRVERAHALAAWLRQAETPVLARVADGAVLLDLRTVEAADVCARARSLVEAFGRIVAGATAPQESGGGEEETVREASTPAGG
jgi:L-seryl-tRNA(Ser) seleniumtransferase